ncbi:hypothetical protein BVG19_g1220 [[Candida] boidinii]|nr:hypothetical protein BVG19_g1220 [[Candida] boidinii]OWB51171.1 hypothetical protein B5S27_g2730 [[Candida] boidinii]
MSYNLYSSRITSTNTQSNSASNRNNVSRRNHNERNQEILRTLLREDSNKFCADCKHSKNPRWASWNLGIFICIRCSGIHRSMGTHISRVKSVDLDSWTDEQVKNMVIWGNSKANSYWESKLPDNYSPDESKIENFVRTKYDMKKWVASSTLPDPNSIVSATSTSMASSASSSSSSPSSSISSANNSNIASQDKRIVSTSSSKSASLLDIDFLSPKPASASSTIQEQKSQASSPSSTISSLSNSNNANTINNNKPANSSNNSSNLSFLDNQPRQNNSRPDLKKSILSLYSTPQTSNISFQSNGSASLNQQQYQPQQQQQQYQPQQQQYQQQMQQNTNTFANLNISNNVWSSTGTTSTRSNLYNSNDDVFKNVWK